jgi:hypothetical protein
LASATYGLTPYDEFPVHQAPLPFSHIPSTDYNWDDGYYWGAFNPQEKVFLAVGMRVNPNTDMVGGYALLNEDGRQVTVRFNRCWRRDFNLQIGPFRYEVLEPLKKLHLVLDRNDSGVAFDLVWEGVCPAFVENRHVAVTRGRHTTDQTRYSQPGAAQGTINSRSRTYDVRRETWSGARDHSWGLYAERPPLGPVQSLLPPRPRSEPGRAMRFWTCFRADPYSGFFHFHETADGAPCETGDVFGGGFAGHLNRGFSGELVVLSSIERDFEYRPDTRILQRASIKLTDQAGRRWDMVFDTAAPPWVVQTMGYMPGSWKDGGTFHTYHGSEELAFEWDEFDFSKQPFRYTPYRVQGDAARDTYGLGLDYEKLQGVEYLAAVTLKAPDGSVQHGAAQVEHFINGRYSPYGFE